MRKSDLVAALERIPGDPEIEVRVAGSGIQMICNSCDEFAATTYPGLLIDRINEFPRPEIVVIEK